MNILRLSLFSLKKKKKEAIAIAFLTMISTLMLGVCMANIRKMNNSFDESFASSGSYHYCAGFNDAIYRDEYRTILENTAGVRDVMEAEYLMFVSDIDKDGEISSYTMTFVTEKTERKIEDFVKREQLPENKIAGLSRPIWLPVYFENALDYKPGDTFTLVTDGIRQDFDIAGFYETGLMAANGYSFKCIVTENDYALYSMLINKKGSVGILTGLWFNCDEDFNFDEYYKACSESSYENIENPCNYSCDLEKEQAFQFLRMFLYFLAFFSAVTMLAALFVITHRISNDIEDQMQQIGVLEALGYRSWEISLSYVGEYLVCGGIGAVTGGIIAALVDPAMDIGVQKMIGRTAAGTVDVLSLLLVVVIITALVVVIALAMAAQIKKYPPVVAFRKGIRTHHFGKNILPLEKSKSINISLAIKSFIGDIRSSFGVALCVIISGIAILFCANTFDFFKDGLDSMVTTMTGMDATVDVELVNGVDAYAVKDEIAHMPGVRKVRVSYGGIDNLTTVKGSENAYTQIYDDYNDSEYIHLIRGRYPEHDNEVMITVLRGKIDGVDIGDSIVLEGSGVENKYIITGVTSSLMYNGTGIYLTTDGYLRTKFNARPVGLSVYLEDGISEEDFEQQLYAVYGRSVKDCLNAEDNSGTLEERIRSQADSKMAMLVSYYGVTNTDYAIVVDDQVITGNSRGFVIKNVSSLMSMAETQMGPVAAVSKAGSAVAVIVIAAVVAVILGLIVSGEVKRQRKNLGIMKGLGYSSKDLMTQLALKTMPVTVISVIIAAVLTKYIYSGFWLTFFGAVGNINIPVTVVTSIALMIFCYAVTYICAGKVKAISVTELMTE